MRRRISVTGEIRRLRIPSLASASGQGPADVLELFFHTKRTVRVARLLLALLISGGGKISRREMSAFATRLEAGELGVRMARSTFYGKGGVRRVMLELGLIELEISYDDARKVVVPVYRIVTQPALTASPCAPSLIYNAWRAGEMWNEEVSRLRSAQEATGTRVPRLRATPRARLDGAVEIAKNEFGGSVRKKADSQ